MAKRGVLYMSSGQFSITAPVPSIYVSISPTEFAAFPTVITVTITIPPGGALGAVAAELNGSPLALTGAGTTRTYSASAAGTLFVAVTGTDADGNPISKNSSAEITLAGPGPGDLTITPSASAVTLGAAVGLRPWSPLRNR